MRNTVKILLISLILSFVSSIEATDCASECHLVQIKAYFAAMDKISRAGSSAKEVDALLSLTDDSVKYIHDEYEADFDKTSWRKAFIRNLDRGAYKNGPENKIGILNVIYGKNHTAIEYSHGKLQKGGTWQKGKPLFVLFGFKNGKISLVKEYW